MLSVRASTNNIPLPVTVADLLDVPEEEEKFRISSFAFSTIRTMGKVAGLKMDENRAYVTYQVCDVAKTFDLRSAPTIAVLHCLDVSSHERPTQNLNLLAEGSTIVAVGKLRLYNTRLSIVSFQMRLVENEEEVQTFQCEARLAYLYYSKNIPERSAEQMEQIALPLFSTLPPTHADAKYEISQTQPENIDPLFAAPYKVVPDHQERCLENAVLEDAEIGEDEEVKNEPVCADSMDASDEDAQQMCEVEIDYESSDEEFMDDIDEDEEPSIQYYTSKLLLDSVGALKRTLIKILAFLDYDHSAEVDRFELFELNRALLFSLQRTDDNRTRDLIGRCLGAIGLVDPEIATADYANDSKLQQHCMSAFISDRLRFYQEFIEACLSCRESCSDATSANQLATCVRFSFEEIRKVQSFGEAFAAALSSNVYLQVVLNFREPNTVSVPSSYDSSAGSFSSLNSPVIGSVSSSSQWICKFFAYTVNQMDDLVLKKVLTRLLIVGENSIASLLSMLLPNAILQIFLEDHQDYAENFKREVLAVFSYLLQSPMNEWLRSIASSIFSIFDFLEKFEIQSGVASDSGKRISIWLRDVLTVASSDFKDVGPLSVMAAISCNCFFRALKWLEIYAIPKDASGIPTFKRELFYRLEYLYISLGDVDGVDGAFSTIQLQVTPTIHEQILALQAVGKFTEAHFLCQSVPGHEIAMIKCLLRMNQPLMARNSIESYLSRSTVDEKSKQLLLDHQLEALSKMGDWDQLSTTIREREQSGNGGADQIQTWGARLASIISSLQQEDTKGFKRRLRAARQSIMNSLASMTFENAGSHSQSEKYIIRLHALKEVEQVKKLILDDEKEPGGVKILLHNWEKQLEAPSHSMLVNLLESLTGLRVELLRATGIAGSTEGSNLLCRLLLTESRLARRRSNLQSAFTFLSEARQTNVQLIDTEMEYARYHFSKQEYPQAVNLLQKAIDTTFPEMSSEFRSFIQTGRACNKAPFAEFERRKPFSEAQLLLAEFKEKSQASRQEDLVRIYQGLESYGENSEVFYYHFAVFFDSYCESSKELTEDLVCYCLRLYKSVLEQGGKYLAHIMPRMLSIWFDSSEKCAVKPSKQSAKNKAVRDPSMEIKLAFATIDHYYFYTSFSQLISRICHPDGNVFKTLKGILADLISEYPHQSIWRSIAISRSKPCDPKLAVRSKRCAEVYDVAMRKCSDTNLGKVIKQYDFLAGALIRVAEDSKTKNSSFSKAFPFLPSFLESGAMSMSAKSRKSAELDPFDATSMGTPPELILPFVDELLESAENNAANESVYMSQIQVSAVRDPSSSKPTYRFKSTYIVGIEENYEVLKSNAMPKKITLIGSDGKKYPLLAKAQDELRKDARFIDVERMLNSLFVRDSEARKRRLAIRSYGVIPLQETGGIIEWVPNLITLAAAATPLQKEKSHKSMCSSAELQKLLSDRLSKDERLRNFRELYPRYPIVMSEWLRRNFLDASKWYKARLGFTRSASVMSMVGFVLGLGDRHSENLLIDTVTGDVVHVDFNMLFDKGEYLRVPEVVPFRLTRNMVDAFGSTGIQGTFRKSSECTMRVMRNEERMLVTVLQSFVHDPLLEWTQVETRNQQSKQGLGNTTTKAEQEAQDAVELIRLRLTGNIATAKFHRPKHNNKVAMSVEGEVAMLIEMASDEQQLSRMYVGWNPLL